MTNYDPILGISNKWAPIVFAVLYFFIFIYYVSQAIRRHASIYSALAFFSLLRIVAFSLRAAMANDSKAASNKGIAIAYAVLYTVGFFSILLSAYRLLRDRERLARMNRIGGRITTALGGVKHERGADDPRTIHETIHGTILEAGSSLDRRHV